MNQMYYCNICGYIMSEKKEKNDCECPNCRDSMFLTEIPEDMWLKMDEEHHEIWKDKWKNMYPKDKEGYLYGIKIGSRIPSDIVKKNWYEAVLYDSSYVNVQHSGRRTKYSTSYRWSDHLGALRFIIENGFVKTKKEIKELTDQINNTAIGSSWDNDSQSKLLLGGCFVFNLLIFYCEEGHTIISIIGWVIYALLLLSRFKKCKPNFMMRYISNHLDDENATLEKVCNIIENPWYHFLELDAGTIFYIVLYIEMIIVGILKSFIL